MVVEITEGIKVIVKTRYRPDYSDPMRSNYMFSYRITIENNSNHTVQLISRHWHIFDSCGEHREVEGDGVVGLQPILRSGDIHEYESACNLSTDMGRMHGTFLMERRDDKSRFLVKVPVFEMFAPYRMN